MGSKDKGKRPAVFLDRDGVLTREKGYVHSVEELEIFSYVKSCVAQIHRKGYLAIVITNQSGVARGYFTEDELLEMNRYLKEKTGVDAVYYCPHYEQGIVEKYAVKCGCRKPKTGMIMRACREFEIDLSRSYMVGDRTGDILCGQSVGIQTVLVESEYGRERLEKGVRADNYMADLRDLIKLQFLE